CATSAAPTTSPMGSSCGRARWAPARRAILPVPLALSRPAERRSAGDRRNRAALAVAHATADAAADEGATRLRLDDRRHAAIDVDGGAGDEAAGVGDEEAGEARELLGAAHAAQRHRRAGLGDEVLE